MPKLYGFQYEAVSWLQRGRRRYLADDCGLGKTVEAIVAANEIGNERPVVICPAIARTVWLDHWREWGRPSVTPHVFSYDMLVSREPLLEELLAREPDLVILDEAHKVKNPEAKRTQRALRLANRAPCVWLLSGSPMPNHPGEFYAPMRAIWPDELRALGVHSHLDWINMFCEYSIGEYGIKVHRAKNVPLLREILGRHMLRRTWEQVALDLPPLRWETVALEVPDVGTVLEKISQRVYKEKSDLIGMRKQIEAGEIPTTGPISTMRRTFGEAKAFPAAKFIAGELREFAYPKVVVLAFHLDVLDILYKELKGFGLVRVEGKTSAHKRECAVTQFQSDPKTRVFLGQITATGMSITLHAAHEIVLVEQMWSPEENWQAIKRVHRIGQEHPCRARMLTVPNTIDDAVARVLERKMRMIEEVVE